MKQEEQAGNAMGDTWTPLPAGGYRPYSSNMDARHFPGEGADEASI